ncbi:tRNA1(Val) (adenine(37)-N6)-methyltransferase [Parapedobacter sp. DT-150]|uniref:tRNA1(Val) (adenine(37)-N6)-methyltransferase n=1 Tax=Parapedobacter sp. DT-150 TaxID=3396162 RepID=UPI003F1BE1C0
MSVFRFKQFDIDQEGCPMKINTDGVLLGAMAAVTAPQRILDIGTGTGVIALMLAQRFPLAAVDAIEIDAIAAHAASKNVEASPFARRVDTHATALADFTPRQSYELMVSNPPYFLDSLKNHDARKRVARHTDRTFFMQLLACSVQWLTPQGSLQVILPVSLADTVRLLAENQYGMTVQGAVDIRSFGTTPVIRRMLAIGKAPLASPWDDQELVIYEEKGVYSQAYRKLLSDFFLAF